MVGDERDVSQTFDTGLLFWCCERVSSVQYLVGQHQRIEVKAKRVDISQTTAAIVVNPDKA